MNIHIFENKEDLYKKASNYLLEVDFKNICLATGSTMIPLYQKIVEKIKKEKISWENKNIYLLDEYLGLTKDHSASFFHFIKENLLNHIDIKEFYSPDLSASDLNRACEKYKKEIDRVGEFDLLLLGIGSNGHIAFNEPGSLKESETRIVSLKEETRIANKASFGSMEKVAYQAITLGIKNILEAKKIILIATGNNKAKAIQHMMEEENADWPCSYINKHHGLEVFLDKKAASLLY